MAKSGPEMRSTHVIFSLVERPFYENVPRSVKIILQNFKNFLSSDLPLREKADCLRIHRARCTRFVPQSRDFGSARASSRRFSSFLTPASILTQKSSGTLIRSVLKE